jgi:RimJ/RimL family protein N-acetyltransferase
MTESDRHAAAARIAETPQHCIHLHALQSSRCRARIAGAPHDPAAILVEASLLPGEPMLFGEDVDAMWALLRDFDAWTCAEVSERHADTLAERMNKHTGRPVRQVADAYTILTRPPNPVPVPPEVRLLTRADADADLYADSAAAFEDSPENARLMLEDGIVAAAIVDDRAVASIEGYPSTARYTNLMAETLPVYRNRGYATAAAALVVVEIQRQGRTPVWSASVDNPTSLRVAEKLGFERIGQMVYVIPTRA